MDSPSAKSKELPSPAKPDSRRTGIPWLGINRPYPGVVVWAIVVVSLAALAYVRASNPFEDEAIVNILTLAFGFFAFAAVFTWFVFCSSYPGVLRYLSITAVVLGIAGFFAVYKIDRVSGTLIPTFRRRFSLARDHSLAKPKIEKAEAADVVDLSVESATDFAEFLGPKRNAVLADVYLERDWEKSPPTLVWKQPIGAGWCAFSARNGFAVTLEQRGEEQLVTCYELLTGKLRWAHSEEGRHETVLGGVGPRSTPTIHGGDVFAVTAQGIFLRLDGASGKPKWRVDLVEKFGSTREQDAAEISWGRAASPLIVDDLVVVSAGGPTDKPVSLAAFKQDTGELAWQGGNTQISYASPALATIAGVRQILSVNESNLTAHDPKNGEVLWQAEWPGDSSANATASQAMLVGDNQVLLSKGYSVGGQLLEVTKDDAGKFSTKIVWENSRVLKTKFTNAAIIGQHAYDLSDGLLECVDLTTGKHTWKGKRYGQGQLLAVGDVLLIMTENAGDVVMVDASPEKFTELGKFPALEGQTWNTLCLTGKYLLVRNSEEAACFELTLRDTAQAAADK